MHILFRAILAAFASVALALSAQASPAQALGNISNGNWELTFRCYHPSASYVYVDAALLYSNRTVTSGSSTIRQTRFYGIRMNPRGGSILKHVKIWDGKNNPSYPLQPPTIWNTVGYTTVPSGPHTIGYSTNTMPWRTNSGDRAAAVDIIWEAWGQWLSCSYRGTNKPAPDWMTGIAAY